MGDRDDPRSDGRGRAAGGPTGRVVRVPRVARRAVQLGLGHAHDPELGAVGLAREHDTGAPESREQLGVVCRHVVAQRSGGEGARLVGQVAVHVLDEERHPPEGPVGQVPGRRRVGLVVHPVDHRVEAGVHRVDPGQRRLHQLRGGHLTGADQVRQAEGVVGGVLVMAHGAILVQLPRPTRGEGRLDRGDVACMRDQMIDPLTADVWDCLGRNPRSPPGIPREVVADPCSVSRSALPRSRSGA